MFSEDATWRSTVGSRHASPHKDEDVPLMRVPGLRTNNVTTDPMHCFHLGWGQDLAASAVVLLCNLGAFEAGALDKRMEVAYTSFIEFCTANGRTTSCDRFSKQDFDMKTLDCALNLHHEHIFFLGQHADAKGQQLVARVVGR